MSPHTGWWLKPTASPARPGTAMVTLRYQREVGVAGEHGPPFSASLSLYLLPRNLFVAFYFSHLALPTSRLVNLSCHQLVSLFFFFFPSVLGFSRISSPFESVKMFIKAFPSLFFHCLKNCLGGRGVKTCPTALSRVDKSSRCQDSYFRHPLSCRAAYLSAGVLPGERGWYRCGAKQNVFCVEAYGAVLSVAGKRSTAVFPFLCSSLFLCKKKKSISV